MIDRIVCGQDIRDILEFCNCDGHYRLVHNYRHMVFMVMRIKIYPRETGKTNAVRGFITDAAPVTMRLEFEYRDTLANELAKLHNEITSKQHELNNRFKPWEHI